MPNRHTLSTACFLLLLVAPVWAQAPTPPPALSALDAARLQIAELAIDNAALKLELARREAEQLLRTLQQPGYTLSKERGPDGVSRWVYRPAPAPSTQDPPPPPRQE